MTLIFGMGVDLDLRQVGIVGQGRRSKVKVTRSENVISRLLLEGNSVYYGFTLSNVMSCVCVSIHHGKRTFGQNDCT